MDRKRKFLEGERQESSCEEVEGKLQTLCEEEDTELLNECYKFYSNPKTKKRCLELQLAHNLVEGD
eukprot:CAMPEP_0196755946 /NCGR_PEP_ID=MMETSP1091-20130531/99287_1 /TAXON_ID=302021 /ORGANISM="Rhodomonas sp., Strain CCMP768" /LENGTH=65 /DNA_ID=CAMNT_0042104473 /DNA_START=81 /DNA_END=275 /DNA_ORIENTATION=+